MFLFGLLAFLQNVFIPGYILLTYFDLVPRTGNPIADILRRLVYGFGLSLTVNYLFVFYLTQARLYTPITLYFIVFCEALLLLYYFTKRRKPEAYHFDLDLSRYNRDFKTFLGSHSLIYNLLLFLALVVLSIYVFYFFYFLGSVFMHWDPALAWNRFAIEWAGNQLPSHTWRYPQLMPANWSISYVLMQNSEVQCFAKAIMPLFSIGILLLFLDLALQKKRAVYLFALILHGGLAAYLYHPSIIVSGYVDIGVSFFAFLAFHALYSRSPRLEEDNPPRYLKSIGLAIFFAATAGITKQAGLFILIVILVWVLASLYRHRGIYSRKKMTVIILFIPCCLLFVTASWYILKEIQIRGGSDTSEIAMVQSVHHTPHYVERLTRAVERVLAAHPPIFRFLPYAVALLLFLGMWFRPSSWVTLLIVIPYTVMWGLFFGYDSRNLALVVPFMAFSAAYGAVFAKNHLGRIGKKIPVLHIRIIPLIVTLVILATVLNFFFLNKDAILKQQNQQKLKMGEPDLNQLLYQFHHTEGLKGKIATNYYYIGCLPELKLFFFKKSGRIAIDFLDYLETDAGQEIHYLLMPIVQKNEKEVYSHFQQNIKSGRYRVIFKLRGYKFVDIRASQSKDSHGGRK